MVKSNRKSSDDLRLVENMALDKIDRTGQQLAWCLLIPSLNHHMETNALGFGGSKRFRTRNPEKDTVSGLVADATVLRVCQHRTCAAQGSKRTLNYVLLVRALWNRPGKEWQVEACSCLGACGAGPNVLVRPSTVAASATTEESVCGPPSEQYKLFRGVYGILKVLELVRETIDEGEAVASLYPELVQSLEQQETAVAQLAAISKHSSEGDSVLTRHSMEALRSMQEQAVATLEHCLCWEAMLVEDRSALEGVRALHRLCAAGFVALSRICLLTGDFEWALTYAEAALKHHGTSKAALQCRNEALNARAHPRSTANRQAAL
jgi:hypothetical protein